NRNGEPLDTRSGLDAISIVPVPLYVLRAVIDHVFVALPDQVEKALPGYVTGLNNGNAHQLGSVGFTRTTSRDVWLRLVRNEDSCYFRRSHFRSPVPRVKHCSGVERLGKVDP